FNLLSVSGLPAGLAGCTDGEKGFVIDGTFKQVGNIQTVVLHEGDRKRDTALLNESGQFKVRRTASHPRLFTLVAGNHHFPVILQNGEHLKIAADLMDKSENYEVSGSELSDQLRGFAAVQREKVRFEEEMNEDFRALSGRLDPQAVLALREEFVLRS